MAQAEHLFTSESVTEGHPDKIADQISDAVLDAIIAQDPTGRVACECLLTTGLVVVAGEITTSCYVDIPRIARETTSQPDLVQRMQGIVLLGVFLKAAPFVARRGLGEAEVFAAVERSLRKFFGKRGEAVVRENMEAVRRGYAEVIELEVLSHA